MLMNTSRKSLIGLILLVNLSCGLQAFGEDPFGPTNSVGNGWSESTWFGWVYDPYEPMYMHAQHGWVYAQEWGDWVWLWDYGLNEWFATSQDSYPMIYDVLEDCWLWYYTGSAGPRWYVEMESEALYSEYHGALMPFDMIEGLDLVLGMTSDTSGSDEEPDLMTEALGMVLLAFLGDPATSVCPTITRSPEVIDIESLPPIIDMGLDFGSGCSQAEGGTVYGGSLQVLITEFSMGETGFSAEFLMSADDLTVDGLALIDGDISGSFLIETGEDETMTIDVMVDLDNLVSMGSSASGQFQISGVVGDMETFADTSITVTMTNLSVDGGLPNNGTLTLEVDSVGLITIDVNLLSIIGPADLSVQIEPTLTEGMLINTMGSASLFGYGIEISDVLMEPEECESFPVSGSISVVGESVTYSVTFSGDCDDGFRIVKH